MDDRDLQELFRDVPGDAPPPSFGVTDVAAASKRATARQRLRIAGASTAAVLVLAGGALFVTLGPLTNNGNSGNVDSEVAAAAPQMDSRGGGQPSPAEGRPQDGGSRAEKESSKQGDGSLQESAPGAAGTERCKVVDRRLATALAGELPVDPPSPAIPGELRCEGDIMQAAYRVQDGPNSGVITVGLVPGDMQNRTAELSSDGGDAQARTDDGALVVVKSRGNDGGPKPYAAELQEIAERVAARL